MTIDDLAAFGISAELVRALKRRGYQQLTRVQQGAIEAGLFDGTDLLVCAPTSAGKSLVADLLVARHAGSGVTVYLVSHRALAAQVQRAFDRHYVGDGRPLLRSGLFTGERDTVGRNWAGMDVVVSTYEKFYGSIIGDSARLRNVRAIVADEVQLVGESQRGPTAEFLLSELRRSSAGSRPQFVGLSATAPNGRALAAWLDATALVNTGRLPPLEHEVWSPGQRVVFRDRDLPPDRLPLAVNTKDVGMVVGHLLNSGLGPVAVMATQKNDAKSYAAAIARRLPVLSDARDQLIADFRSAADDPDSARADCDGLLRGVGVHHADLSREQRECVEDALTDGRLSVIVATPTLIAGVNFPIRTVLYPKMTRFSGSGDSEIDLAEYLNGAGRAGRLLFHERGSAIILAESLAQAQHYQRYTSAELPPVASQLRGRSLHYQVLHLAAPRVASTVADLASSAAGTLHGFEQGFRDDPQALSKFERAASSALQEAAWSGCWHTDDGEVSLTPTGRSIAASGLEPLLAMQVRGLCLEFHNSTADGIGHNATVSLLRKLCAIPESLEFLPFYSKQRASWCHRLRTQLPEVGGRTVNLASVNDVRVLAGWIHALYATRLVSFSGPAAEDLRAFRGERDRLCQHLARLIHTAASILDLEAPQEHERTVGPLRTLAGQLEFMTEARAVPMAIMFDTIRVPNMFMRRIIGLAAAVDGELPGVLTLEDAKLKSIVGPTLVGPVRRATLKYLEGLSKEDAEQQLLRASRDSRVLQMVENLLRHSGCDFEEPVAEALRFVGWAVTAVGANESSVDVAGQTLSGRALLLECKTTLNLAGMVSPDEAFDLLKNVPDTFQGVLMTVGRPQFSPWAVEKVIGPNRPGDVRLITGGALAELVMARAFDALPETEIERILVEFRHVDVARVRAAIRTLEKDGRISPTLP